MHHTGRDIHCHFRTFCLARIGIGILVTDITAYSVAVSIDIEFVIFVVTYEMGRILSDT